MKYRTSPSAKSCIGKKDARYKIHRYDWAGATTPSLIAAFNQPLVTLWFHYTGNEPVARLSRVCSSWRDRSIGGLPAHESCARSPSPWSASPPFGDRWTRESGQSVDRLAGTRARFSACQRLSSAPPPIKNTFFVPASPGQGPLVTHTDPSTAIYCRGRLHFPATDQYLVETIQRLQQMEFLRVYEFYIYIYIIRRSIRCFLSLQ